MKIVRQTFTYYHMHLLRDIKFAEYFTNHLDTCKLIFAKQKLTLGTKFDIKTKFRQRLNTQSFKNCCSVFCPSHGHLQTTKCRLCLSFESN